MKKILVVTSECIPFAKTGGLADVVGTLPGALIEGGYEVRVIMPNYTCIDAKYKNMMTFVGSFHMDLGWRQQYVGILKLVYNKVEMYFIDNEYYFSGPSPISNSNFDIEKFCFFSKAVLAILPFIEYKPDVIHCNDWQTGLVPVYLKSVFMANPFFNDVKSVMTVHNLKNQGRCSIEEFKSYSGLPDYLFTADKLEIFGQASMLKGGLVYADKINTVSKNYSNEIQSEPLGEGLEGLMVARHKELSGITNGIDYASYNPESDKFIYTNYNKKNYNKNKAENKILLQKELGLPQDKNKFVIAIISKLVKQKGIDLIDNVMKEICNNNAQVAVIGIGDTAYENMFYTYQEKMPKQISANIYVSEELEHKIFAGSDVVLMPSLFEPCGLSQLIGLKYGTIPIVRETGGLKETIEPYNEYEETGTGFSFANYDSQEMLEIITYAQNIFTNYKDKWNGIIERGMDMDFSLEKAAKEYGKLYESL